MLEPYYPAPSPELLVQLSLYLDLILKWNARTNLTAVREPREIVTRHFGESLFAAPLLPFAQTLLDFGSGAGFPGIPLQLALPDLRVTLAESQNKKAAFLREVIRQLNLGTTVHSARVEDLPLATRFDLVALRAVDNPKQALVDACSRLTPGGTVAHWHAGASTGGTSSVLIPGALNSFISLVPCTERGMFHVEHSS